MYYSTSCGKILFGVHNLSISSWQMYMYSVQPDV